MQYYGNYDIIILGFAKVEQKNIFQEEGNIMTIKERPKAILKNKPDERDCFVDGCEKVPGTCEGIPKSNKCAACRLKKNLLDVHE